jgi:chromosome segregation protein
VLRLKKIRILGFKSFCDRTELAVPGTGVAVVVGPNGCGKSNILDAVSWVLGEQSAKSLRGTSMQDVIFAGTRDRKPLGMAEVTLTMVDPETYEGPALVEPAADTEREEASDWDEDEFRRQRTAEAEEIVASQQPGQAIEEEELNRSDENSDRNGPQPVVLKIRRRKFQSTPQKGEVVITRRLFRTGESEYLINGKLTRLRDIQDIFMGTGLGPDSYAIIAQEQIGQLLSSNPHDRRAVIEEAAGITRYKTKKRLAELRLESAKQNLARVDDIFEEITRQMNSLKRQAAKAERFAAVRDELRSRLRVVLASRLALIDAEHSRLQHAIAELTERIEAAAAQIAQMESTQHVLTERGYEFDLACQTAQNAANAATLELERTTTHERANTERLTELKVRLVTIAAEFEQTQVQLTGITEERAGQSKFLETAANDAWSFHQIVETKQQEARSIAEEVFSVERELEVGRRHVMHLLSLSGNARNGTAQAQESLTFLENEAERLTGEMGRAGAESANLNDQHEQMKQRFDCATETLQGLESKMATLRTDQQERRKEESVLRTRVDELRSAHAAATGRRNSLESLLHGHSYSTDTVQRLLQPGALDKGLAVGTLADFLEVCGEHESVVDEFLQEELNYIVVKSWDAAEKGVRLLKSDVDGRATFLVHDSEQRELFEDEANGISAPGLVPLRSAIRALNGFGHSLEVLLPKLKHGYLIESAAIAQQLANEYSYAYFLTPEGECFHCATVTGGKPGKQGPLALKRELRAADAAVAGLETELAKTEAEAGAVAQNIEELKRQLEARSEEHRLAERDAADSGAALKQLESEVQRIERRLHESSMQAARNEEARIAKRALIEQKQEEATRLEAEHAAAEAVLEERQNQLRSVRQRRELLQQEAAHATAELATLEERRRGAEAAFQRIDRLCADLERRLANLAQQQVAAETERAQRTDENAELRAREKELALSRDAALDEARKVTAEAHSVREQLAALEMQLKAGRAALEQLRDERGVLSSSMAKLCADLEHVEASCLNEVNVVAAALRSDGELPRLTGDELAAEEEACHALRERIEQMGPVNMMALDEYKETAQRHGFLEVQRKDLIESIENTQETIREIEQISRSKFEEALARINENFALVFAELLNGGNAALRITDAENQAESGLEIIASPPGKKLQNVLLLSGGEKALTALALLVAIFQFRPSPFCILDEVDAPLDETNVGRFADFLRSLGRDTQFMVVTHSKRMMQAGDLIYGVTMQDPGVSKIVSVRLGLCEQRRAIQ